MSKPRLSIAPPSDPVYGDDYLNRVLVALRTEFPEFDFDIDRDMDSTPEAYTVQIPRGAAKATKKQQRLFFQIGAFLQENCKLSRTRH